MGEPTTNPGRFSMASTVSAASEGTYEIEFKTSPVKKKTDAYSIVSGRRRRESVHTVSSHSASVRSGCGRTVVAAKLARQARLQSAAHGQIAEEARSIRSKSGISRRSTRASASGRDMRSKPMDGNDSRGGSDHVLAPSNRSRSKSHMSSSHRSQTNRPPVEITWDISSSPNTSSITSTYPSSYPSILFDPTHFEATLCNDLVDFHTILVVPAPAYNAHNNRAICRAARLTAAAPSAPVGNGEFDDNDGDNDGRSGDDDGDPDGNLRGDPVGNSGSGDSTATTSVDWGSDSSLDGESADDTYGDDSDDAAPESCLTWLSQSHPVVFSHSSTLAEYAAMTCTARLIDVGQACLLNDNHGAIALYRNHAATNDIP